MSLSTTGKGEKLLQQQQIRKLFEGMRKSVVM